MNVKEFDWETYRLKQMNDVETVKYLVVHHSDSADVPAAEIDNWHRRNGYVGIGYHYVVRSDGSIEKGRPDDKAGAHAQGYNSVSLGVVLTGDFTSAVPTAEQMDALEDLLTALRVKYPQAQVVRHRDLCATSCPGDSFPWDGLIQRLERGNQSVAEQWKLDIVQKAKEAGLITEDHNPDDTATKWFVLAVCLNLLKELRK